jgi:hypothetical protein
MDLGSTAAPPLSLVAAAFAQAAGSPPVARWLIVGALALVALLVYGFGIFRG